MEDDFKEFASDINIIKQLKNFNEAVSNIEKFLKMSDDPLFYDKLNNEEKIKYNTLMSFHLNSLFWMHLRVQGADPAFHEIRNENDRLKKVMGRAQELFNSKTPGPRIDVNAAKRFIRSSLWTPNNNDEGISDETEPVQDEFEDDDYEIVS
ncbi:GSCOCG00005661001-RA-CDS [Cotesia congregata]|uniref:Nuclear nucleic acid-binding protein C1D n=1 Tax=Cotesia congregata TaxID=51543 RepID=A0A8J2MNX7_COTCN|nr:GSCOCG00005661001-RA-CDS [Cotesia congregata]CAG5099769.1 Similar to c1d: Nuclear nucleic acid-binding protein C1D (Danio rerio) [Cotesia congregata]